ncbi:DUF1992 domain-containing protein [Deltaproteobacteria bacterium Smac51]|nr:DUF1992 domain-containing protein [Deltaproteobacteria bacterium Smac51]
MDYTDGPSAIAIIAERKIREAMEEGQFDNLPGKGKPLKLEDLSHLPPELRMAYTILKNSGYLEESNANIKIPNIHGLLAATSGEGRDCGKLERLKFLLSRANRSGPKPHKAETDKEPAALNPDYLDKMLKKV